MTNKPDVEKYLDNIYWLLDKQVFFRRSDGEIVMMNVSMLKEDLIKSLKQARKERDREIYTEVNTLFNEATSFEDRTMKLHEYLSDFLMTNHD